MPSKEGHSDEDDVEQLEIGRVVGKELKQRINNMSEIF